MTVPCAEAHLGEGNDAGVHQRLYEDLLALWQVGVEGMHAVIKEG